MNKLFPRTTVGGVSLSRMIIGTNWILGYSHTSVAADNYIRKTNGNNQAQVALLKRYLSYGVDTIMGPMAASQLLLDSIKQAEDETGKKLIIVDTPIIDVTDTKEGRKSALETIEQSRKNGATFCMPHHSSVEQLVNKHTQTIDRLPDYLSMVRDNGMIPGLSAHMPELVIYSDQNEYDVETYIQIYNCMGFLMQIEVEYINKVIWNAKKPVMTIKSMAAGRVSPFVGLSFSWNTIRPQDMVTVGCMNPDEIDEDVEISMAVFEKRQANLEGRNSPNKTEIMKQD